MKDQIEALHRLQTQDRRLVSIERKLAAIPRRKVDMQKDLEKLESMLQAEVDKLEDSRNFRMDQSLDVMARGTKMMNANQPVQMPVSQSSAIIREMLDLSIR